MTALIETVRVRRGVAPLWYLHLRRLAASCQALGIPLPGELLTPEGGPDRVHRLEVIRRGLELRERDVPRRRDVLRLVIARETHRPYPHKTTERGQFERAMEEALAEGADDALLLTVGGYVAEAGIWSLFWWEGDRVCAPPLALGILPGVARARVIELTGKIEERRVTLDEVRGFPMFAGNSVRGLVPAMLPGDAKPASHDGFRGLAERFWA